MKKPKINIDREELSKEEIVKYKNYNRIIKSHQQITKRPTNYRNIKLISVIILIIVLAYFLFFFEQ